MGLERIIQERVPPTRIAIRDEQTSITYGELRESVRVLAQKYYVAGIRKGSVVGLYGRKSID